MDIEVDLEIAQQAEVQEAETVVESAVDVVVAEEEVEATLETVNTQEVVTEGVAEEEVVEEEVLPVAEEEVAEEGVVDEEVAEEEVVTEGVVEEEPVLLKKIPDRVLKILEAQKLQKKVVPVPTPEEQRERDIKLLVGIFLSKPEDVRNEVLHRINEVLRLREIQTENVIKYSSI